jgi:hypothetical protein
MRIPRIPRACSAFVSALFILLVGCSNPSSTSLNLLTIKATPATVSVGGAVTLQAIAHLSDGTTQDVTSSTQWTLSNPSLAAMGTGVLTAKAPGTLSVQAAYIMVVPAGQSSSAASSAPQTLSSSAQVTITPAGTTTTTPAITWSTPAPIQYGTALSSALLDAAANVPGSFAYIPAAGTVLKAGNQTLTAVFTPTDTKTYSAATATVQLTVNQASPGITWAPPSAIQQGTALSAMQLNATANVPGTFSYSPAAGTVPPVGTQTLTATFTPSDATDYVSATAHNSLTVNSADGKSNPAISWSTPAAISYGAALSGTQLNATASVAGTFAYTPAAGAVLKAGTQTLTAVFTPTDTATYSAVTATVQLMVTKANPVITWAPPSAIQQGTAISGIQLNATANVPGTFSYSPAAGTIPPVGTEPLTVTFTPSDATDYMSVTAHNSLTVTSANGKSSPVISWSKPAAISYGAALSSTQLNATSNVAGTFAYTPAAGTVLKAGTQTLSAVFTPTDTTTYSAATATVQLTVNQATPAISWPTLAAITQGTALSSAQLDASANVPGAFSYNPGAGNVPAAGTLQLTATFTPTDTTDYSSTTAHNTMVVNSSTTSNPSAVGCGGPTINVNPSMSPSTLQSTITSAPNCAVIVFAAGTYGPMTSTITIPCSVSLTGPTVPYSQTPNQTATIIGSSSFMGWAFQTTSGCSQTQTIQYLEWNGELPSNGGGFLEINAGTTNITVQNNWLHGANAPGASEGSQYNQSAQIWMNGSASSATTSNVNILWNIFGSTSFADCATAMNDTSSAENDGGGGCNGVGMHNNVSNITIEYNIFHWLEEPIKTYESPSSGSCNNVVIDYNSVTNFSRIGYETQCYTPGPTLMYIQYNNWGTRYGSQQTYDISAANGCGNTYAGVCETHTDYNVDLQAAQGAADVGIEIWGGGPTKTTANYNLLQGYLYNAITWSVSGNFQFNNNTFNIVNNGDNTSCSSPGGGYFNEEASNGPAFTPTCTGNTFSNAITGTTPSVAPTISPANGTFSGSQVVTITNPGTNRDTNTTDWCTTDGSTPTPGSGTAVGYYNGGTLTVTSTTTVKCVGMWGALNQPYSYPSGYAYVPSALVSSSLTPAVVKQTSGNTRSAVSGADTIVPAETTAAGNAAELASVAVVPAQATVSIGSTTQLKAIATFSDGSTKDVTTGFAWTSSDTRTITASSSGLLSGLATGKATITGSYQGRQASVPAVSSIGEVNWSGPIVITEAGTYSGNWQSTDSKTPAVTVATTAPVVIENAHISSVADLIKTSVAGADLTVRNSVGLAANPAVKGQSNGVLLEASSPARLDVENNYVENAGGGVLVHGYSGNRDGQQTIVIRANRARNLNGLLSDGKGGYLPGVGNNHSVSRFIELDNVQAVPGIDVGWNEVINYPGRSLVTDNIAIKRSSGTPNQPLEIHDTYIQGAYPYTAAQTDYRGGGIKTEGSPDDNPQQAPAFNSIHDNQVVGTVSYGIAFTAGHDNIAANNRVISSGMLADGTKLAAQHVGMANGDVDGAANGNLYNNTMHDNLIGWACWDSSCAQSGYRKDQSFPASPGDYSTNSVLAARPITPEIEDYEYQIWLNKTASAGIAVGPAF